jgi:hypothetical protein
MAPVAPNSGDVLSKMKITHLEIYINCIKGETDCGLVPE